LSEFASTFLLPPFSVIVIITAVLIVQLHSKTVRKKWIVVAISIVMLLCLPLTGKLALHALFFTVQPWKIGSVDKPDVIVIPTAGVYADEARIWWPNSVTVLRMSKALQIHKNIGRPVIISGGVIGDANAPEAVTAARFFELQPSNKIILETASLNSAQTGENVAKILNKMKAKVVLLITSDVHQARMAASLRHYGFTVFGNPVKRRQFHEFFWKDIIPRNWGITIWRIALKEYLGIAWYLLAARISFRDFIH
jgi:uncharacterized SAM-binding protein YcdF (DUF218 family)